MKRIAILLTLLLVASCTLNLPDDPKPPKWEIEIEKIPFLKADTLRIGETLEPDDFVRSGSDSILGLKIEDYSSFMLKDELKISRRQENFSDEVGEFKITTTEPYNTDINFAELYPNYTNLIGTSVVVPTTPLIPIERTINYTEYVSLEIASGGIRLVVENRLGFPFGNAFSLELIDIPSGDQSITMINVNESIPSGQSGSYWIDLAGKTISSNLKVILKGTLNGSGGQEVFISENSGISLSLQPQDIIVTKAVARLPQQSFELTGSVDVNTDTLTVKEAGIRQGYIDINIDSQFDFPVFLMISTPELQNENGDTVTANIYANPGIISSSRIPLDRSTLKLDDGELNFAVSMEIYPDGQSVYVLDSEDELSVDVTMSDIYFDYVNADMNLRTDFPEIREDIIEDPPEDLENINFMDAIVRISIPKSPFDVDLNIQLAAYKDGVVNTLQIDNTLGKDEELILSKDGINYDGSSPTIVDIINMLPEEIRIFGDLHAIGKDVVLNAEDVIDVEYSIEFPLSFSLSAASYTDTDSLDIDNDARENMRDLTFSGDVEMTERNAVPLSGSLSLFVGTDSLNVNHEILSITLPAPKMSNGIVTEPGISSFNVGLQEDDILQISNSYFYRFAAQLDDSELSTLTANDYIIVEQVYLSGKVLVDTEDE
jgi:hypothetical protein